MTEIGRITIKVTPDTTGFREKVRSELSGIGDAEVNVKPEGVEKAKAEIDAVAKDRKAKVKVDVDESSGLFLTKLEDSLARMKASLGTFNRDFVNKSELFTGKTAPLLGIDFDQIQRKMDLLDLGWDKKVKSFLSTVNNPFDLGLKDQFDGIQRKIDKLNFDNLRKNFDLGDRIQQSVDKVNFDRVKKNFELGDRIQQSVDKLNFDRLKTQQIKLEVDDQFDFRLRQRLRKINEKVKVDVDVDKGLLSRIGTMFVDLGNNLAQSVSGARVFGLGMGTILGIATLIPPAIALVSGALLTLPGIVAGVLTPIAAIALGMDGIKKAAETLKQPFGDLKKIMSDSFQTGLTPVFENLKAVFPVLNEMMPKVSEGLVKMADALVQSVTSSKGLENIRSTIGNIGAGLSNFAPGIKSFSDSLLQLVSSVAEKFPGVGDSLSRIGDQFAGWIDKITTKDPATGISQLDGALRALKETLAPIGGAIGDLFTKGFDKLNDPAFAQGMKEFTEDLRALAGFSFDSLSKFFTDINDAIQTAQGGINDLKDAFNSLPQGVKDFLGGDSKPKKPEEIIPLAGTPGVLKDGPLGKAIERDLDNMDNTWAAKWLLWLNPGGEATDAGTKAGTAFKGSFDAAAGKDGVLSLVPGGTNAAEIATKSAQEQIAAMREAFKATPIVPPDIAKANASDIIGAFGGGGPLGASADIGVQLSANIQKATDQATQTLRTGLAGLSTEFQTRLAEVGTGSKTQIDAALQPLSTAPQTIATAFGAIAGTITGAFAPAVAAIAGGVQRIAQVMGVTFAQLPAIAMGAFNSLKGVAEGGMNGMVAAVATGSVQVIAEFQKLPAAIGAIGSQLFAAAQAAGAQVGAGLAAGITASTGIAVAAAQSLAGQVSAAAGQKLKIKSPSRVFAELGDYIGQGLAVGIDGQKSNVVATITELLQAVKDVFGSAQGLNLNFIMNGATAGVSQGLSNQVSAASVGAKDLATNFSEAVAPAQALTAEGKQQLADVKEKLALLDIQKNELKIQKNDATSKEDKKAIQAQIDQLQNQRDILALEEKKLSYAKQYGEEQWNAADALSSVGEKSLNAGFSFAKSNADQLMSDLNMGGGAITGGASALWDWGTKAASNFIFNVSNVDEAMAVKQKETNKQAMQYTHRAGGMS